MSLLHGLKALLGLAGSTASTLPAALPASAKRPAPMVRVINARYDAAQTSTDNARHWQYADRLSADAAANPWVRKLLRERARYEVGNNPHANGIVWTIVHDTIGRGPRLKIKTDTELGISDDDARTVEREFTRWCREVKLAKKLRLMRKSKCEAGEAFALLSTNPKLRGAVKLDVVLIEPDQVTTPDAWQTLQDPFSVDGIKFDRAWNPVEYHVLKHHPGSQHLSFDPLAFDRVAARHVLHYFFSERMGQRRGVPEITSSLSAFALVSRYFMATVTAAEWAASQGGTLETTGDPAAMLDAEELASLETVDLDPKGTTALPAGYKHTQFKAEQPTTTHDQFMASSITSCARPVQLPRNKATGDSSGYNYSSGQLDHKEWFAVTMIEQSELELEVVDRVFEAWLAEASLKSGFLPQSLRSASPIDREWFWDRPRHADPEKEALAQEIRLRNKTTTFSREMSDQGLDWEEHFEQIARETARAEQLGIELAPAPPQGQQPGQQPTSKKKPQPAEVGSGGQR